MDWNIQPSVGDATAYAGCGAESSVFFAALVFDAVKQAAMEEIADEGTV